MARQGLLLRALGLEHLCIAALGVGLGVAGSATLCQAQSSSGSPPTPAIITSVVRGQRPEAFYLATSLQGLCPSVQGQGGSWLGTPIGPAAADQTRSCSYTWQGPDSIPEPARLRGAAYLKSVRADVPGIVVQQDATEVAVEDLLSDRYEVVRQRMGEVSDDPRSAHVAKVRVAVVDTASGDFYGKYTDPSQHGRSVGRIIEEVACSSAIAGGCKVEIKNYPALSLTSRDQNGKAGIASSFDGAGSFGTRGLLALQIEAALSDWLRAKDSGKPVRLIINLSVGWSGCWNPQDWSPLSDPVYQAILRARCHGALIVAAAGNVDAIPGCPSESFHPRTAGELVFPAHMARDAFANDPERCAQLGSKGAPGLGPLILPVSAVDEHDLKLAVAAQEASLVAYGSSVVVPDGVGWTRPLSGTSASAATVSGVAAAVWAHFPARTPAEVAGDLSEGAALLERPSPTSVLCTAGDVSCPDVKRVSLCGALAHAGAAIKTCGPAAGEASDLAETSLDTASLEAKSCELLSADACAPAPGNAVDSVEQPWMIVATQPGGNSCGTCEYDNLQSTFKGLMIDGGTATNSYNGLVEFSATNKYLLWSHLVTDQITTKLPLPVGSATPATALLRYYRATGVGNIWYTENVRVY